MRLEIGVARLPRPRLAEDNRAVFDLECPPSNGFSIQARGSGKPFGQVLTLPAHEKT